MHTNAWPIPVLTVGIPTADVITNKARKQHEYVDLPATTVTPRSPHKVRKGL